MVLTLQVPENCEGIPDHRGQTANFPKDMGYLIPVLSEIQKNLAVLNATCHILMQD